MMVSGIRETSVIPTQESVLAIVRSTQNSR